MVQEPCAYVADRKDDFCAAAARVFLDASDCPSIGEKRSYRALYQLSMAHWHDGVDLSRRRSPTVNLQLSLVPASEPILRNVFFRCAGHDQKRRVEQVPSF
jgi:hypothetical protein